MIGSDRKLRVLLSTELWILISSILCHKLVQFFHSFGSFLSGDLLSFSNRSPLKVRSDIRTRDGGFLSFACLQLVFPGSAVSNARLYALDYERGKVSK